MDSAKGDLKSDAALIENKHTERASYSLKLGTLRKIEKEAAEIGRKPIMALQYEDGGEYVILRERDYLELLDDLHQLRQPDY